VLQKLQKFQKFSQVQTLKKNPIDPTKTIVPKTQPRIIRKKVPTLFEMAFVSKHRCVGEKLTRSLWKRPDCYWTITKVFPKLGGGHGQFKRGKVWGFFTWRGVTEPRVREVRSPLKRQWHYYDPEHYVRLQKRFEELNAKELAPETIMGLKTVPKNPPIQNRGEWFTSSNFED